MKKSLAPFLMCALVVFGMTGCATLGKNTDNEFKLKGPENSILVYGSFISSIGILTNQYDDMTFVQLNTGLQNQTVHAETNSFKKYWFAKDVMPGGSFKLIYFAEGSGNHTFFITPGLQGKTAADFKTPDKPGLFYNGICEQYGLGFKQDMGAAGELETLKDIRLKFFGSAWDPLIKARIGELENAKK